MKTSETCHVRIRGKWACFTRPENRTERLSNVVGSVSAWEGCLRAVMGKFGGHYHIESVGLLFYPRWVPLTCNEIKNFGTGKKAIDTEVGDIRTLRTTTLLAGNRRKQIVKYSEGDQEHETKEEVSGVDFVVSFRLVTDNSFEHQKQFDMLRRRLKNGHHWRQPYLGLREFPALVEPVEDFNNIVYPEMPLIKHKNGLQTADYNAQLGLCFYGTDWADPLSPNYFAKLEVTKGVVKYPSWDEVRKTGIRRGEATC